MAEYSADEEFASWQACENRLPIFFFFCQIAFYVIFDHFHFIAVPTEKHAEAKRKIIKKILAHKSEYH